VLIEDLMQHKIIIWVIFVVLGSLMACQDALVSNPKFQSPPSELRLSIDSTMVDTTLGSVLHLPFQWIENWPDDSTKAWLESQSQYSLSQLLSNEDYKSNYAEKQIFGFPVKDNQHYYALAEFNGQRGIYRSNDLSTLSTYEPYLLEDSLNLPTYQLQDFSLLDSAAHELALLLYHPETKQFQPAYYNFYEDTIVLWTNLQIREDWLISEKKMWVHSPKDKMVFGISPQQDEILTYPLDSFQQNPLKLLAVLDSNKLLIQVDEGVSTRSYYQISVSTPPEKIFTFKTGKNKWLGYHAGFHYFQADFKTGWPQLFKLKSDKDQDWIQTLTDGSDTLLLDAQISDTIITSLQTKLNYAELRHYGLDGQLLAKVQLSKALLNLDFKYYFEGNHTLIRQLSPEDGLRWINVDTSLQTKVEPIYRSLIDQAQFPIYAKWQWLTSYDGTPFPVAIFTKSPNLELAKNPSLIIPVSSDVSTFRNQMIDLAVVNKSLRAGFIVAFVFPRGYQNMGRQWFQKGSGPFFQLAYDDLQASISYFNEQQIGAVNQRTIWGVQEGALSAAALEMQRPELVSKVILQDGIYDLRRSATPINYEAWEWINTSDSLSHRLAIKYSPQFYPIRSALYPNSLLQVSNQSIFANHLQSVKWMGKLQSLPGDQARFFYNQKIDPVLNTSDAQEWEQMVWNFIYE
ncbi:MAG: prolyl oligopeptidase family serine peptidase, partial [Bacteroidota bacterium]